MQTRSQTKQVEMSVDIDFDESSRAWRANKRHMGDGHFEYTDVPRNNLKQSVWCPVDDSIVRGLPPRTRRSPNRYSL
jgi:hypothetical protein